MVELTPFTVADTDTWPAVPAGVTAVHKVLEEQVTPVAGAAPKTKLVSPACVEKPVPAMETTVPPATGPLEGVTLVTVGAAPVAAEFWMAPSVQVEGRVMPTSSGLAPAQTAPCSFASTGLEVVGGMVCSCVGSPTLTDGL